MVHSFQSGQCQVDFVKPRGGGMDFRSICNVCGPQLHCALNCSHAHKHSTEPLPSDPLHRCAHTAAECLYWAPVLEIPPPLC